MKKIINQKGLFCQQAGVTLIEVVLSIMVITFFSLILINNFPNIKARLSLARATHKFAQDIRKVQDMALSGKEFLVNGQKTEISGYGIYVDVSEANNAKYVVYADSCPAENFDKKYVASYPTCLDGDSIIETIELEPGVKILSLDGGDNTGTTSINFSPPNPTTTISNLSVSGNLGIGIVLGISESNTSQQQTIQVYPSGLIEIK